jgi:hypothetical protein
VGLFKREPDGFKNAVQLTFYLEIAEPQDTIPELPQNAVSHAVAAAMIVKAVLMSIDFYDESRATTFEIHDVVRDGRLAPEVVADRSQLAESDPKYHFLSGHRLPQLAGDFVRHELPTRRLRRHPPLRGGIRLSLSHDYTPWT